MPCPCLFYSGIPFDTHLTDNAIRDEANRKQYSHLTSENLQASVEKYTMQPG
jgi:hypothetical protein